MPKRKPAERRGRGRPSKADAANKVVGVRLSKKMNFGLLDKWAGGIAMTRSAAAREIIKFLDK